VQSLPDAVAIQASAGDDRPTLTLGPLGLVEQMQVTYTHPRVEAIIQVAEADGRRHDGPVHVNRDALSRRGPTREGWPAEIAAEALITPETTTVLVAPCRRRGVTTSPRRS
jgi:hypothetical protein